MALWMIFQIKICYISFMYSEISILRPHKVKAFYLLKALFWKFKRFSFSFSSPSVYLIRDHLWDSPKWSLGPLLDSPKGGLDIGIFCMFQTEIFGCSLKLPYCDCPKKSPWSMFWGKIERTHTHALTHMHTNLYLCKTLFSPPSCIGNVQGMNWIV